MGRRSVNCSKYCQDKTGINFRFCFENCTVKGAYIVWERHVAQDGSNAVEKAINRFQLRLN